MRRGRGLWIVISFFMLQPLDSYASTGLHGCLYFLDETSSGWSQEQWREQVAWMHRAGLRHLIVCGVADAVAGASTQSRPSAGAGKVPPDPPPALRACDRLLEAARGTDLRAYLSLWAHPQWFGRWDLREEIDTNQGVVQQLTARYRRCPNFAGWYIPHEIYVVWGSPKEFIGTLYRELSSLCKQATPDKQVTLSPFFILDNEGWLGDFRYAAPDEYERFWAGLLANTSIDVVALQDSGEHLSFYTMDQRRPFLLAMKRACDKAGKAFWVNIETAELDIAGYEEYAARFGRKTHVNDAKTRRSWRAISAEKLAAKVQLAREFTDTMITWGYREYWDPMRGDASRKIYMRYLESELKTTRPATTNRAREAASQ